MVSSSTTRSSPSQAVCGIGGAMKNEVPLTLEGASVLHQMFRVRWQAWKGLPDARRRDALEEATKLFTGMEQSQTALFSLLGHKGDLMLLHFRNSFDELHQ